MHSCLYLGNLQHRRWAPVDHVFRYRLYLAYLDLDEVPGLLHRGYGLRAGRFAATAYRRSDHMGDPRVPLADFVREQVAQHTGTRPDGPIRLLTLLRNWGYYFNPLSLYYCFDAAGTGVETVMAEVTNTPWGERHAYVLHAGNRQPERPGLRFRHPKGFHVSPFMDLDMDYQWQLNEPGSTIRVGIVSWRGDQRLFDVHLVLRRQEWTRRSWFGTLARYPWMTARVSQAIYWQAFRLWRKRCPFHSHPKHSRKAEGA